MENPIPQNQPNQQPLPPQKGNNDEAIVLDIRAHDSEKKESTEKNISIFKQVDNWFINISKIKLEEKLLFFNLLGSMIGAGLPLVDSLTMLLSQTKNPKMKQVIEDIRKQIESGSSLSEAMKTNSDVFDEATCSIIEAGEKSGKLNEIFKQLIHQYEQSYNISKKVKSVMSYPIIVIIGMILLITVVLIFVVPKLEELFGGSANLPLPTRILIGGSDLILTYWYILLLGLTIGGIAFQRWLKTESGLRSWSFFQLKLPLVGKLKRQMILAKTTSILGFLISSGVPIVQSLKITSHTAENYIYQEKLLLAADDLIKGISIVENLSDNEDLFPPMLISMMAVGEKTASLDNAMGKAAEFYNNEIERSISVLSKNMEPIILAIIASVAVFMILAIYLPILQMNNQIVGSL